MTLSIKWSKMRDILLEGMVLSGTQCIVLQTKGS